MIACIEIGDAGWVIIGVLIGALFTGLINFLLQKNLFNKEHSARIKAKDKLKKKLEHNTHIERSFSTLRKSIYGAFSDQEIRNMLFDIDAKRRYRKNESEWWYLESRECDRTEEIINR